MQLNMTLSVTTGNLYEWQQRGSALPGSKGKFSNAYTLLPVKFNPETFCQSLASSVRDVIGSLPVTPSTTKIFHFQLTTVREYESGSPSTVEFHERFAADLEGHLDYILKELGSRHTKDITGVKKYITRLFMTVVHLQRVED